MYQMTFQEYEDLCEQFARVSADSRRDPYWPAPEDLERFFDAPGNWLRFACYLCEVNPDPTNREQAERRKKLLGFVNDMLMLADPEDGPTESSP